MVISEIWSSSQTFGRQLGDLQQIGSSQVTHWASGDQALDGGCRSTPTSSTASTVDGSDTTSATPIISAIRTTATEPGGLTWTANRPTISDIPSTPRSLHSPQTTSLSYVTVTKARHHPHSASQSSTQPTSPSTTPSPMKPTETTRHHRTQILRRLPYNTTTKQIIDDVTRQLGCTEDALFERVLRDPKDSRRFYLTYRTDDLRQYATKKGFYTKHLHIKPTDGSTNGYIPFLPTTSTNRRYGNYCSHMVPSSPGASWKRNYTLELLDINSPSSSTRKQRHRHQLHIMAVQWKSNMMMTCVNANIVVCMAILLARRRPATRIIRKPPKT